MTAVMERPRRSLDQNAHFHALIDDIARQYEHCGQKWHAEDMKRLLLDVFKKETKDDPNLREHWKAMGELRLVPAIDGNGFVILGEQTRRFPKPLASAFIEWLLAFAVENGISTRE